jgi:ATP-dependent Clp protease ATP-binding subunit ClpC
MNTNNILDNLSTHLKSVIANAISLATSMQHESVTPTHMLMALYHEQGAVGSEILHKVKLKEDVVKEALHTLDTRTIENTDRARTALLPELDDQAKKVLEKAMILAYEHEHKYVGSEHLLHGIISIVDPLILRILKKNNITKKLLRDHIQVVIHSTNKFPEMEDVSEVMAELHDAHEEDHGSVEKAPRSVKKRASSTQALDAFATLITGKKAQATIDPVIGREEEINRLMHILCRRTKNNPVLVGEPGVGKTAIVEGLAKRIVEGSVPAAIKRKKIYSLDLALLVSGTIYRGEFEARLKQLIDEVSALPDCILFVDELHNIIGAGSNQGTMDAANILKPALARGKLRCIGATTFDEYKKYITNDPALERRFQAITVEEPTQEEAIQILSGIKRYYETYHRTTITKEAIEAAVTLSSKYIHTNFLPDKAIDLLDEAAASVRVERPETIEDKKYYELVDVIQACQDQKEHAIRKEAFEKAKRIKTKQEKLEKQLHALNKKRATSRQPKTGKITKKHIAHILSKQLHIDVQTLLSNEWEQLTDVEKDLHTHIFGQETVIHDVTQTLRHAYLRQAHNKKPLASYLFVGPSGVGKTALAKHLARALYHDEKALIKFDMSEFAEGHSVSKLLGSPAGYVGHKERNQFTDELKQRPYAVLLFDEIDKAHPDVRRLLFQILDEGELTDSTGKKIHFEHTIVIMTTNVGSEHYKTSEFGFGDTASSTTTKKRNKKIEESLKEYMSPALLGRIGKVCYFDPLSETAVERIVRSHIHALSANIKTSQKISITPSKAAIQTLARTTYNKDTGAREVEQRIAAIVHELVIPLVQQKTRKKHTFTLKEKNGDITLD